MKRAVFYSGDKAKDASNSLFEQINADNNNGDHCYTVAPVHFYFLDQPNELLEFNLQFTLSGLHETQIDSNHLPICLFMISEEGITEVLPHQQMIIEENCYFYDSEITARLYC